MILLLFPRKSILLAVFGKINIRRQAMNFQHLRYVVEVEKVKSISKAAKNLYMGQPNLSKAIKDLEKELGITIFRRTSKGVEPTTRGIEFLQYANTILSQLDELQSLYTGEGEEKLRMRVSIPRASYVATAFTQFLAKNNGNQEMNINFKEESPNGTIQDVANGESNLGIVRYQSIYEDYFQGLFKENGLQWEILREFDMVLLMHKDHPLAKLSDIPYHLLDGYIEIVHGDYQVPSLSFHKISKEAHMERPAKRICVYDRASQLELLEDVEGTYMWVSPMPYTILAKYHLVQKACIAAGHDIDAAIYQDKTELTKMEVKFLNDIRNENSDYAI